VKGIGFNLLETVVSDAHGEDAWDGVLHEAGVEWRLHRDRPLLRRPRASRPLPHGDRNGREETARLALEIVAGPTVALAVVRILGDDPGTA